jgi:hypothetical protein
MTPLAGARRIVVRSLIGVRAGGDVPELITSNTRNGSPLAVLLLGRENVGQAELLAWAVWCRLPCGLGRKLARGHVLGEVCNLAESRSDGRADLKVRSHGPADLKDCLGEATRTVILLQG